MAQGSRRSPEDLAAVRLRLSGERTRPIVRYLSLLDAPLRTVLRWIMSGNSGVFLDAIWEPEQGCWLTSYDAVKRFHSAVALAEILERTDNGGTPPETQCSTGVETMSREQMEEYIATECPTWASGTIIVRNGSDAIIGYGWIVRERDGHAVMKIISEASGVRLLSASPQPVSA